MPFDASSDVGFQEFEYAAVHRPRDARRMVARWAGLVWYEDRYNERFGLSAQDESDLGVTRERLLAVVRSRVPHLDSDVGNGRSCDCGYLRLALAAFDRDRLVTARRRYLTASTIAVSSVFATATLAMAFSILRDAAELTSDRAFGFIAGVSGGLVVATIQMVFAITTILTDRVAQTVEWPGFHPDSDWHLLGLINPRHRRRLRHAHLKRAAGVVLRRTPDQQSSPPTPKSLTARLGYAYRAFKANS